MARRQAASALAARSEALRARSAARPFRAAAALANSSRSATTSPQALEPGLGGVVLKNLDLPDGPSPGDRTTPGNPRNGPAPGRQKPCGSDRRSGVANPQFSVPQIGVPRSEQGRPGAWSAEIPLAAARAWFTISHFRWGSVTDTGRGTASSTWAHQRSPAAQAVGRKPGETDAQNRGAENAETGPGRRSPWPFGHQGSGDGQAGDQNLGAPVQGRHQSQTVRPGRGSVAGRRAAGMLLIPIQWLPAAWRRCRGPRG